MSVWQKLDGNGDDLMGSNGIPGDDPLKIEVSVAIAWNNRTRINAWNDNVGIEIMVDPAGLAELIDRLTEAQAMQVVASQPCPAIISDVPGEEIPPGAHENRFGKWCYCSEPESARHTA